MNREKEAVQIATDLSKFVNGASRDDLKALAKEITGDHRTLQQSQMVLFLECVDIWADDHAAGRFDMRNESTCLTSVRIRNTFSKNTSPTMNVWPAGEKGGPFLPYI